MSTLGTAARNRFVMLAFGVTGVMVLACFAAVADAHVGQPRITIALDLIAGFAFVLGSLAATGTAVERRAGVVGPRGCTLPIACWRFQGAMTLATRRKYRRLALVAVRSASRDVACYHGVRVPLDRPSSRDHSRDGLIRSDGPGVRRREAQPHERSSHHHPRAPR